MRRKITPFLEIFWKTSKKILKYLATSPTRLDTKSALITLGVIGVGYLVKNEKMQETGLLVLEALTLSSSISLTVKVATGRSRPIRNRGNCSYQPFSSSRSDTAFFSGRATTAFTIASLFADVYEYPWVGVLTYSLASLVVWERLYDEKHWASGVWAGAVLGTVVGKSVVYLQKKQMKRLAWPR